jgi:cation diffusion facilitator CzcD-associated flavoprotein CzcO
MIELTTHVVRKLAAMPDTASAAPQPAPQPESHEVLIIGTGFAGLGMAIKLREAGVEDFALLERASEIGGTWRDNVYPGCACDVPSHLYSFSFAPKHDWTRAFAPQAEIQDYLLEVVDRYRLRPSIRFDACMERADYDEARAIWTVVTRDGRRFEARVLVSAMGPLSNPAYPDIPGLEQFEGARFHSAQWDHDYELRGKRVAVIGTGASAIQFVPAIADKVAKLDLYQRTAPWVIPKPDREFGRFERALYAKLPPVQAARRAFIYWSLEARALGFTRYPQLLALAQKLVGLHLRKAIADPTLRAKLTPDYTLGCKRILLSDDYYPALAQAHVEVLSGSPIRATARGLIDAEGREREVDAIIYGTGFRVQDMVPSGAFWGRGGQDLLEVWRARPEAYKGTAITGFPNLFFLLGPNTGLGHNSMVYMIESQVAYVVDAIRHMRRHGLATVEVREAALTSYNAQIQDKSAASIWQSGCRSWYLDAEGRNTTLWPDFTFRFRAATAAFDPDAYQLQTTAQITTKMEAAA